MKLKNIYSIVLIILIVAKVKAQNNLKDVIEIKNASFNSQYSDFGAVKYNDSLLLFSSSKKNKKINQKIWKDNKQPYLKIYEIKKTEENSFVNEQLFDKNSDIVYHVSSMSFNNSKTIMYFTANNLITKKRGFGKEIVKLKLYSAKLINNKWTEIKELPFNSEKYSIGHPSLSLDEKKLYFISDMPGGYGLTDIYNVDILPDGSYSSPVNLGEKINTAGKEMFPFVDENNILYYSSNGIDKNVGDLDIYYTDLKNESTKVFNAGLPINSKSDDFAFFKIRGKEKGYFSSNRIGGKGDDDIYLYSGDFKEKEICKEFINIAIKDSKTFKLLDSVSVLLRPIASKIQVEKNTKLNGRVKFEKSCVSDSLKISALKKGYLPFNKSFKSQKGKLNYELLLEKDILSEKIVEVVDRKVQIIIDDVYFSYGKFNISSQSKLKLAKLIAIMNKYPEIKIKVNSHTDSRSGYLFNLKLSKKRALSIRNYIISKGISKNRVYFEGYGEQKIINKCFNNVKCSEEEHLVNRRTTFLIVD